MNLNDQISAVACISPNSIFGNPQHSAFFGQGNAYMAAMQNSIHTSSSNGGMGLWATHGMRNDSPETRKRDAARQYAADVIARHPEMQVKRRTA